MAEGNGNSKGRFDLEKITRALHFLRAFSNGGPFGSETEGVQELLSFAEYSLGKERKARMPERAKLEDIALLDGEWTEGGYGLFRFGNTQRKRKIQREPFDGELYVEYQRVRYRRSDFPQNEPEA